MIKEERVITGVSTGALVLVLTLTFLGTGLRLYNLGGQGIWWDEMFTLLMASGQAQSQLGSTRPYSGRQSDVIVTNAKSLREMVATKPHLRPAAVIRDTLTYEGSHPPLYHLFGNLSLSIFGFSEFAIRLPAALAGGLTIPFLFVLGRRLYNAEVGLVAAGLFAFAPTQVYYGQEARMYSLMVLAAVVSTWLLIDLSFGWREDQKTRWLKWLAYSLATVAGLYTQYLFICMLGVHFLYVVLRHFRDRTFLAHWVLSMGVCVVFYLPWVVALWLGAGGGPDVLSRHGTGRPVGELIRAALSRALGFVWISELRPYKFIWLWIALLFMGLWAARKQSGLRLLPLWAALPLVTAVIFDVTHGTANSFVIRYYLLSAPAVYLLAALGIVFLRPRSLSRLVTGVVLVYLAVGGYWTAEGKILKRIEIKEAGQRISETYEPDDILVMVTSYPNIVRAINLAYYVTGPPKITTIRGDEYGMVDLTCFVSQARPVNHLIVVVTLLRRIVPEDFDPSSVLGGKRVLDFMEAHSFRELSVFRYRIRGPDAVCAGAI